MEKTVKDKIEGSEVQYGIEIKDLKIIINNTFFLHTTLFIFKIENEQIHIENNHFLIKITELRINQLKLRMTIFIRIKL